MRGLLVATMMLGAVQCAEAADMPDFLRGSFTEAPVARVNWQGYYIGVQGGYGSSDEKFNGSNSTMTASMLANTLIESEMRVSTWPLSFQKQSAHVSGYGAFAGYNSQWDDVVIGLEMSYLHGTFGGTASGSMSLFSRLSDGDYHAVTSSATSSINISDIGTFRARAGYAYGSFLPYLFGGLALGYGDLVRTAFAQDVVSPGPGSTTPAAFLGPRTPHNLTEGSYGHLLYGYTAGLGFDMNLTGGWFLRGEWEYLRFTSAVDTSINTVRGGLGYKF
jgi:outer membrane immunogenic protein